jgi:hypothetical protein
MRLAESLRRGVMETGAGGIINRFKIKKRRSTLFFEDILAEYIKECESSGYGKEMQETAREWNVLTLTHLTPDYIRKLPHNLLTLAGKKIWKNLGLMDDITVEKAGGIIEVRTKNESITRIIGKNDFMTGFYEGVLNSFLNSGVDVEEVSQSKASSVYRFRVSGQATVPESKTTDEYYRLNKILPETGLNLDDAFRKGLLQLKENNRIYFRGRSVIPVENTVFHLIGNRGISLDSVAEISCRYFSDIAGDSGRDEKLRLIKNLLQAMGWGAVGVIIDGKMIRVSIKSPPYGLQAEKDNWGFMCMVILGFLRMTDKSLEMTSLREAARQLDITYSSGKNR